MSKSFHIISLSVVLQVLTCCCCYSQELSFYFPGITRHFVSNKWSKALYAPNEGGDSGLVISYTNKKHFTYSVGRIKNSYGTSSNLLMFGYNKNYRHINLTYSIGLADGYGMTYATSASLGETEWWYNPYTYLLEERDILYNKPRNIMHNLPDVFKNNGVIIIALVTVKVPVIKNLGIQVKISPAYVYAGLYVAI